MELNRNGLLSTENQHRSDMKLIITQSLTALGPIINTVTAGLTSGYSAVLLPQLNSTLQNNSSYTKPIDYFNMSELSVNGTEEGSWIASAAALSMGPSCLLAGLMMETFGRKGSFLISCPVQLAGWLMMAFAPSVPWLIIGRLICGVCSGVNGPLTPVFIAETSEPRLRGPLLSGISMGIALGVMFSHALGTYLHWRLTAFLCGLIQVVIFVLCLIYPESPTWLLNKNKPEKAHKVWVRLRGANCEKEFQTLLLKSGSKGINVLNAEMELEKSLEPTKVEETVEKVSWKDAVFTRTFVMPFLILNVVFFTCQFSGPNAIAFYSITMFQDVAGPENAYTGTLLLDFIRLVCSILACWLTRNYRRRTLMFLSGYLTAISLALASGSLLMDIGRPWLPICFLFAYMCFITIGLVPLPWLLCGELYASSVRGLGSGVSSALAFFYFFLVVKAAPGMFADMGAAWTFVCYAIVAFLGSVFMYFWLPETKDKTLQEISDFFVSKKGKRASETEN